MTTSRDFAKLRISNLRVQSLAKIPVHLPHLRPPLNQRVDPDSFCQGTVQSDWSRGAPKAHNLDQVQHLSRPERLEFSFLKFPDKIQYNITTWASNLRSLSVVWPGLARYLLPLCAFLFCVLCVSYARLYWSLLRSSIPRHCSYCVSRLYLELFSHFKIRQAMPPVANAACSFYPSIVKECTAC